jgi:hypothetical protein
VAAAERDGQQSAFAKKRASADRPGVLASEIIRQQKTRPGGERNLAQGRMARDPDWGMRTCAKE